MKFLLLSIFFFFSISSICQSKDESNFYELDKARELLKTGSIDKGLKFIDSIIEINPINAYAYEIKGSVYANEFKDYLKAIDYYKKFEEYHPENAMNLANIGKNYFKLDSVESGKKYIKQAFEIDPYNEYIINQYAFHVSEDIEEEILLYHHAIIIYKLKKAENLYTYTEVLGDIYNNLGYNLYLNKNFLESTVLMLEGLEYGGKNSEYLNNLGNSLQRLNYLQDALRYYDKALEIEPNKLYSLNGKANTYQKLQQLDSACTYWSKAVENGYKFKEEWREIWDIEDPVILLSKFCKD